MSTLEAVKAALNKWPEPRLSDRGVSVPTHCLYPSNSVVKVTVAGGADLFVVDDNGGSLEELEEVKIAPQNASRLIHKLARSRGLDVSKSGAIYSRSVPSGELEATIVLVANASKEAAEHLLDTVRPPRRNLRLVVERLLEKEFHSRWSRDSKIVGASNKRHTFDYVVQLRGDRQLILDVVVPESSSINAAVVAHLDVRHGNSEKLEQRIVYDDQQVWSSSDLALLKVGARAVPLSSLEHALDRLAA